MFEPIYLSYQTDIAIAADYTSSAAEQKCNKMQLLTVIRWLFMDEVINP